MSRPRTPRDQVLERLAEASGEGVDGLGPRTEGKPWKVRQPRAARPRKEALPMAPEEAAAAPAPMAAAPALAGCDLASLRTLAEACTACRLAAGRTRVVFGTGSETARLMFVGEAPGRDEDLAGEPFVGRAGQLLTDMIEKGMGLSRADVYIANVIKCRPPENRNPEPDEVAACEGYLRRQVALVRPEVIVALGRFAVQCLLRSTTRISLLRGNWHEYEGTPLMPTFHPAYLLRNPAEKRNAWSDLKQVLQRLQTSAGS